MRKKYYIKDIKKILECQNLIIEPTENYYFDKISTIQDADEFSLIWINTNNSNDLLELIKLAKAKFILTGFNDILKFKYIKGKYIIMVENPRLEIAKIISELYAHKLDFSIHNTATINKDAKIHKNTFIGPNTIIGNVEIGEGCIIYGNVVINDNTKIGKNVTIKSGAIIGFDGFGFVKNVNNEYLNFPHIGGVIIEDNVLVGANTCIDKGGLGNTIIGKGTKIDNLVHIAHNVCIGKNCIITANTVISGSSKIGDNSWISPSVTVKDTVNICENSNIGIGAVILKNVSVNSTMIGNPALPIEEFVKNFMYFKKLIKNKK